MRLNYIVLPRDEWTYFQRCFEETDKRRIPQFYCIPKVHKNPIAYRPIVSSVNSKMGDLSKWLDVKLQSVVHLCPCYLKDSRALLKKLKRLGQLPPTAVVVTADAVSMYTNIDLDHCLLVLQRWFELHATELPAGFPIRMILKSVRLVMFNNVFQFDDTYWLQLVGTAMGTSVACMIATIYFSYHEETRILPRFAHQHVVPLMQLPPIRDRMPAFKTPPLLLHARLIDDAIQIWDLAELPTFQRQDFQQFMRKELQFGILDWKVTKPAKQVDFLDLTVTINCRGKIWTKTYVKPMCLHLYIPPASAHPPGVLKSLIFGNLQRFWIQCSRQEDFVAVSKSFFGHLRNRGYSRDTLAEIFQDAIHSLHRKFKGSANKREQLWEDPPPVTPRSGIFVHWEYNPRDIGGKTIRQIFTDTVGKALTESQVSVGQLTIAHSVPRASASI